MEWAELIELVGASAGSSGAVVWLVMHFQVKIIKRELRFLKENIDRNANDIREVRGRVDIVYNSCAKKCGGGNG